MCKELFKEEKPASLIIGIKCDILMSLFRSYEFEVAECADSACNFKEILGVKSVEGKDKIRYRVDNNLFLQAILQARNSGWINISRRREKSGYKFNLSLTDKGRKTARREWNILCENN